MDTRNLGLPLLPGFGPLETQGFGPQRPNFYKTRILHPRSNVKDKGDSSSHGFYRALLFMWPFEPLRAPYGCRSA